MTSSSKFDYDLSGIDRIDGIPTVGQTLTFQRQLATIQTSYTCKYEHAGAHGWSWIMCDDAHWLAKRGITTLVATPTEPGPYTGTTHTHKFKYQLDVKNYDEYKEHLRNSLKAFSTCFTEGLFIDLETDGQIIGYSPMQIYTHIKTNFLLPRDISREITKTRSDLKVAYNPDDIVQIYYKSIQTSKLTLAALGDPITEVEIMRCAFETFEVQSDLKEACREWDRQAAPPTWARMMVHFSIEIQRNRTDPSKLKLQGEANAVLKQVEQQEEKQRLQSECMVAQTDTINRLQEQLTAVQYEQQANGAASVNGSLPGRIPASISTGLTQESMEAMFKKWTATQAAGAPATDRMTGKERKKKKFGVNFIENDLPNAERSKRRYPNSTNYCSSHGYDISPDHDSSNCKKRNANHNEAATITNMLGGVTTNCFHHNA
ncbi:hypothetical protein FRACYDRAFT_248024 [Fragilariopsis cylindrus CCMP1102]|uniref:Uncharacterized protein n=1 Tax=Fragilariopsis cylindrus CCMP1102 TaxID=635003 RepID=A0A1E7EVE3_9STRA|nr:hypothetical protein FRACYDRAFT_248024 [Fragilariopsis cylindrus CCMP1102]|eukprot:OEU09765.1 hypothetical protein FRACYDRAFT_248024 [Fragilariopsis cylindrus CCMP1102]